ncbi:hypothetical protein [Mesorhizobium sp.]|uniref:hypothetical protein n=1 Tax=Mesorhizobium sp. TaxID=1871066 RepID=UPI00122A5B5C|nr:hypothetical protein [Mesorhizobium sp.]TIP18446.1 MAG: hypothetical protein E5X66_15820 [Mesorhizobium sp.]
MAIVHGFCAVLVMVQPGFRVLTSGHLAAFANVAATAATILIIRKIGQLESRCVMLAVISAGILLVALPGAALTWKAMTGFQIGTAAVAGTLVISAQFAALESLRCALVTAVAPMQ